MIQLPDVTLFHPGSHAIFVRVFLTNVKQDRQFGVMKLIVPRKCVLQGGALLGAVKERAFLHYTFTRHLHMICTLK